jgi:hypothetical protein
VPEPPSWAIGLIGAAIGIVGTEVATLLRERRAHRREMLLRRYDAQLSAVDDLARTIVAIKNGKEPPPPTLQRLRVAFGDSGAARAATLVQKLAKNAPARTPGQVIQDSKVLAAQVDAFLVCIRDTEAALGIPPLRDGEQAFNDALAAEQRRWDEAARDLQQKELEAEREAAIAERELYRLLRKSD